MDIAELLAFAVKNKASDLHLSAGMPPMIRVHGDVRRINLPPMAHSDVHGMIYDIMNDAQRKDFEENLECDFSFAIPGLARFRVNAFLQQRGAGAVMRTIPSKILTLEELKAPKIVAEITTQTRGMVLVTGPTGSGKSTTLAAMINHINENVYGHILTVEDPIEFVHESKRCLVNQREVGPQTLSFNNALRSALREDPDVILVGDLRDPASIGPAVRGAADQLDVAQIDAQSDDLAQRDHRVALVRGVGQEQHRAGDAETPEMHRQQAAAGALGTCPSRSTRPLMLRTLRVDPGTALRSASRRPERSCVTSMSITATSRLSSSKSVTLVAPSFRPST